MPRLQLSEVDRERLGAPEWLELDLGTLSLKEAIVLQEQCGVRPSEVLDFFGTATAQAYQASVWLALSRVGINVPWDELDFNINGVRVEQSTGKARRGRRSTPPKASAESEPATSSS